MPKLLVTEVIQTSPLERTHSRKGRVLAAEAGALVQHVHLWQKRGSRSDAHRLRREHRGGVFQNSCHGPVAGSPSYNDELLERSEFRFKGLGSSFQSQAAKLSF